MGQNGKLPRQGLEPSTRFQQMVALGREVAHLKQLMAMREQQVDQAVATLSAKLELAMQIIMAFAHDHPTSLIELPGRPVAPCPPPRGITPDDVQACNDALVTRWNATQAAARIAAYGNAFYAAFGAMAEGIEQRVAATEQVLDAATELPPLPGEATH